MSRQSEANAIVAPLKAPNTFPGELVSRVSVNRSPSFSRADTMKRHALGYTFTRNGVSTVM